MTLLNSLLSTWLIISILLVKVKRKGCVFNNLAKFIRFTALKQRGKEEKIFKLLSVLTKKKWGKP